MGTNNGQKGFIDEDIQFLNDGNTISFGQDTATMFYQEKPYFTGDKIKIVKAKDERFNKKNAPFFLSTLNRSFSTFSWGSSSFNVDVIKNQIITLPTNNGKVDYNFMETFIAELEAERIAELEAYLSATGLKDYTLTPQEEKVLQDFENDNFNWETYNVEKLFGKSTRGKRLKSDDRIAGNLPFITAGETNEGFSSYIGNDVNVFNENTVTIDMFGSAKFRNIKYGADDHVAIVSTDILPKFASVFVASSIHKMTYNGQFNYGRNFYPKDADVLDILLPVKNGEPDYQSMSVLISAIQKQVIKGVVEYTENKLKF